jgi:hypothetical protein
MIPKTLCTLSGEMFTSKNSFRDHESRTYGHRMAKVFGADSWGRRCGPDIFSPADGG